MKRSVQVMEDLKFTTLEISNFEVSFYPRKSPYDTFTCKGKICEPWVPLLLQRRHVLWRIKAGTKKIHFLMITLIVLHWHVHLVKVIFFVLANSFWSAEEVNREKKTALQTNTVLGMSFHISNIFINFLSNGLLNNNRDKLR